MYTKNCVAERLALTLVGFIKKSGKLALVLASITFRSHEGEKLAFYLYKVGRHAQKLYKVFDETPCLSNNTSLAVVRSAKFAPPSALEFKNS